MRSGICADLPDVDREDCAAGSFDSFEDLCLPRYRANETVEVRHNHDIRITSLNELQRLTQTRSLCKSRPARDIEFLECVDERQSVARARVGDTLTLLAG